MVNNGWQHVLLRIVAWCSVAGALCAVHLSVEARGQTTPEAAVQAAVADARALPEEVRRSTRYVWCPTGSVTELDSVNMVLNTVLSHRPSTYKMTVLPGDRLVRVNLLELDASGGTAMRWEMLSGRDPHFHVLDPETELVSVTVPEFLHVDGKRYSARSVRAMIGAPYAESLHEAVSSTAPILRVDYFVRACTTTVDGGLYYRFRGISHGTTLDEYLESRGLSRKRSAELQSDVRSIMLPSDITGKPRRVDLIQGSGARPTVASALGAITYDQRDGAQAAVNDPLMNMEDFEYAGSEVIVEMPNGTHEFTLWDAKGRLVDSVPDDIACDSEIPDPYTKRLQPAIGCVRCHGKHDGWQPLTNKVLPGLLRAQLRVFTDPVRQQRLDGLYGDVLDEPLRLARNSYDSVVFKMTGGRGVAAVSESVRAVFGSYVYDTVDATAALREVGVVGEETFAEVYPAPPPTDAGGPLEDPRFAVLRHGGVLTREQWDSIYVDAVIRRQAWQER